MLLDRKRTWSVAAWLAFLSMAMLFVAPVISRSLPHAAFAAHNALPMALSTSDAQSSHPEMVMSDALPAAAHTVAESNAHSAITHNAASSSTANHRLSAAIDHAGSHHAMTMPAAHIVAKSGELPPVTRNVAALSKASDAPPAAAEPHAHSTVPVANAHLMMSGHGMSPMEEIACGYCQLLIHLPFIQFALTLLTVLLLRYAVSAPPVTVTCTALTRPWPPQRARAPPAKPYCFLPL